jgi:hypothetical protein
MLIDHINKTSLALRILILAGVGIAFLSPAVSNADETSVQKVSQFYRADPETIKMHTRQILSDQNFVPNKTFMQWLGEKFFRWKGPKLHLGQRWGKFILWFITFWCLLSLLAILIHFIYTLSLLIRTNSRFSIDMRSSGSKKVKITSFEELYKKAQELAGNNSFREAISMMMAALLRLMDSRKIISFHDSKTNGDYIRECPYDYICRDEFRKFVLIFEQTIYGGSQSSHKIYQRMDSLMGDILNCVRQ